MRIQTGLIALAFAALGAGTLEAQLGGRTDPRDRRPSDRTGTVGGTIGDIIFGNERVDTGECRVRDAVTPDGRVVQICDNRRRGDDDPAYENRRDGRGRRAHVNDMDGDGDFDARDRAIRKQHKDRAKALKKSRR